MVNSVISKSLWVGNNLETFDQLIDEVARLQVITSLWSKVQSYMDINTKIIYKCIKVKFLESLMTIYCKKIPSSFEKKVLAIITYVPEHY